MEGVVVEQPAEQEAVRATTAGEVFCISEQTVSVPPGKLGLTFDYEPVDQHSSSPGSPRGRRYSAGSMRALSSWRWTAWAPRPITFKTSRGASSRGAGRACWTRRRPRRSSSRETT